MVKFGPQVAAGVAAFLALLFGGGEKYVSEKKRLGDEIKKKDNEISKLYVEKANLENKKTTPKKTRARLNSLTRKRKRKPPSK